MRRFCADAWALDGPSTERVLADLKAVIASGDFTERDIVRVLCSAGVRQSSAELVAPSIRVVAKYAD